jgi:hypothetical protein
MAQYTHAVLVMRLIQAQAAQSYPVLLITLYLYINSDIENH